MHATPPPPEAPFDPEDTPARGLTPVTLYADIPSPNADPHPASAPETTPTGGSRLLRGGLLLLAALITVSAAAVYIQQGSASAPTVPAPVVIVITPDSTATLPPTAVPATSIPTSASTQVAAVLSSPLPQTAVDQPPEADVLAEFMRQPPDSAPPPNTMFHAQTAFTIAPPGPRAGVIQYAIQTGDTVESIAKKFNVSNDTIGWNNPIQYLNTLQIGTTLTILPIDGILYTPTSDETLQQIADKFKVSPYAIINSEYNHLQNATPSFLVPANALHLMIPGGATNKVLTYWQPTINVRPGGQLAAGSTYGSDVSGTGQIEFGGGPGSCGYQNNGGGDGSLGLPVTGYVVVRGFTSYHSGIDLAKPTGSPVVAAGTGTVIFAGWSDWGYGNSIVIAHTSNEMTLYGHLSAIGVRCGQVVTRGQMIGRVGSTGNSTGPHLHFEIRLGQVPVNPIGVMGF